MQWTYPRPVDDRLQLLGPLNSPISVQGWIMLQVLERTSGCHVTERSLDWNSGNLAPIHAHYLSTKYIPEILLSQLIIRNKNTSYMVAARTK